MGDPIQEAWDAAEAHDGDTHEVLAAMCELKRAEEPDIVVEGDEVFVDVDDEMEVD